MIGGSTKASVEEIEAGSELALAEAIANINGVDGQSVAGLLDAYMDAAISSRSSHSWDPQGRIDAAVSTRSSHDWDPQGRVDQPISSRSSHDDPDPNGYIDTAISSRSSHPWDPDGVIPATGTIATQSDTGNGVDWSSKTYDFVRVAASDGDVSVTGSGYIISLGPATHNTTVPFLSGEYLKLDGSTIWGASAGNFTVKNNWTVFWRFESGFTVNCGDNAFEVWYALD